MHVVNISIMCKTLKVTYLGSAFTDKMKRLRTFSECLSHINIYVTSVMFSNAPLTKTRSLPFNYLYISMDSPEFYSI